MRIEMTALSTPLCDVRVGNVYPVAGGWGRKAGHAMILLAITEKLSCLFLIIDKHGTPVDVTKYALCAVEDRTPIAFVDELDTACLQMRSL